jgi:asparagine synthetase B (glutamine-hydrolysing)
MRLDKMGMGASPETRAPFLDHKFAELAMSVPEQVMKLVRSVEHPMHGSYGTSHFGGRNL